MAATIPPTASVPSAPPPVIQVNEPFLKEKAHSENLERLSNPKYSVLPKSGCVTREIYKKTPFYNPTKESIQRFTMGASIFPLWYGVFSNTISCVGFKDWRTNFYSVSSECLAQSLSGMVNRNYRATFIFRALMISMCGVGAYTGLRLLLRDRHQLTRTQMLREEYSGMADFLSASSKTGEIQLLQKTKAIAARLKVNLPFIRANLQIIAHIDPDEATLITHKLSKVVDRLLGVPR